MADNRNIKIPDKEVKPKSFDRVRYTKDDLVIEVVNNGDGRFTLQIFSGTSHRFHPTMHKKMSDAIQYAMENRLTIAPGQVNFKVEWVSLLNSYCVTIVNVFHIMWPELFDLIASDIASKFRFSEVVIRGV